MTTARAASTLLVFGARHLGRTIARELSADGWNAAAVARSGETIASLREELPGVLGMVADAGRAEDVERAFAETRERFGEIDLVVNAITARPRGTFGGDALAGAAKLALEIREIARRTGDSAVCTSGGVVCRPGIGSRAARCTTLPRSHAQACRR